MTPQSRQLGQPNPADAAGRPGLDTAIKRLGEPKVDNPIPYCRFIPDEARVTLPIGGEGEGWHDESTPYSDFELAGPRARLYFDSAKVKCAITTSGGLTPGTNYVIRSMVLEAHLRYRIAATIGIRYGFQGFIPSYGHEVVELTPERVANIHVMGGTILGSSRGHQPPEDIVDALQRLNVGVLFIIGGEGSLRAARDIQATIERRGETIGVVCVPKTIDNDICFVSPSFGFDTAVDKATEAIRCAHVEASGARNGIGLVKVMGRESGFIAAQAALAMKEVDFLLVPEHDFALSGEHGLLPALEKRLAASGRVVIVAAEGAGQHLMRSTGERDASGNPILGDITSLLATEIKRYFTERSTPITLKTIDPSYIIRSVPANSFDRVYCGLLGQHAVHAAMAGKTGMAVSRLQDHFVHVPLALVTRGRKRIDINSDYWRAVMESTGQDPFLPESSLGASCPVRTG